MASPYDQYYEDWKAAGRPGSLEQFAAQQGAPATSPAAPLAAAPAALPSSGLTIDALRQRAASTGASEDWSRFDQGDVSRWNPFYDSASGRFRSMRGAPGLFDKPTECPPGQGPSGPNETDPCTTVGYSTPNAWGQGGEAASNPLQAVMSGLQPAAQGLQVPQVPTQPAVGTTGVQASSASPLQGVMTGLQVTPNQPQVPSFMEGGRSSLQSLMTPYAQPAAAGVNQFQGGLTNMMAKRTKPTAAGTGGQRWFA